MLLLHSASFCGYLVAKVENCFFFFSLQEIPGLDTSQIFSFAREKKKRGVTVGTAGSKKKKSQMVYTEQDTQTYISSRRLRQTWSQERLPEPSECLASRTGSGVERPERADVSASAEQIPDRCRVICQLGLLSCLLSRPSAGFSLCWQPE